MRFDLVDLQLFVAIGEARSITGGAARANLALASASARIAGLEHALGVALLTRGRRGIALTAAEEELLNHARIVLRDVEALRGDLTAYALGLKARLHLLANTASLSEHLPAVLAKFLIANPSIDLDVEERDSVAIVSAVGSGAAEIGVAIASAIPDTLQRFALYDDRLVLVVAQNDPLARRRAMSFSEVNERDFIGLFQDSALQSHLAGHATRLGMSLKFRARLRDFDSVIRMVEAGIGLAVVPRAAAMRHPLRHRIRVVAIKEEWSQRHLAVCVRDRSNLSRPAQRLLQYLRADADAKLRAF